VEKKLKVEVSEAVVSAVSNILIEKSQGSKKEFIAKNRNKNSYWRQHI
jgi:hypothetical protein